MLHHPRNVAPEPYFSAALYVLYRVAIFMRSDAAEITPQQLSDLGDAIHNVLESLTEYGTGFDERRIRDSLAAYDEKWAKSEGDFSLLRSLDGGVERGRKWLQ